MAGPLGAWRVRPGALPHPVCELAGDPLGGLETSDYQVMTAFIDTDVLVRHLTGEPDGLARRARALLESGETLILTDIVCAELVYVLESVYGVRRERLARLVRAVIGFESIVCADEPVLLRCIELYEATSLHFADSYLVADAEITGARKVASFDRAIDKIPSVERIG